MPSRSPSPLPTKVPQNTPYTSRPPTSHTTPLSTSPPLSPLPSPHTSSTSTSSTSTASNPTSAPSTSNPNINTNIPTLRSLTEQLLPSTRLSCPPPHPKHAHLTATIASLHLHPTLEAALHLLNADLAAAHFLLRHMSAPPAVEGMLLHSILHRSEGDFANARAWFGDVSDACSGWVPKHRGEQELDAGVREKCGIDGEGEGMVEFVYEGAGEEEGKKLITDVERLRQSQKTKKGNERGAEGDEAEVEQRIRHEMERIIEWCLRKFGDGPWEDATSAWVRPGAEVRSIGNDMVSGDKGWRKF